MYIFELNLNCRVKNISGCYQQKYCLLYRQDHLLDNDWDNRKYLDKNRTKNVEHFIHNFDLNVPQLIRKFGKYKKSDRPKFSRTSLN